MVDRIGRTMTSTRAACSTGDDTNILANEARQRTSNFEGLVSPLTTNNSPLNHSPLTNPMDYRKLGRSGVSVSRLCLGTMMFGGQADEEESIRIMHAAADL